MITERRKKIEEGKNRKIKLIEEFYEENGRLPKQKEKYQEEAIGTFLNSISLGYTCVSEEQMNLLLRLGFVKQTREETRERKITLTEEFFRENGRLPKREESYQGFMLGKFLSNVKLGTSFITEEQMNRLTVLGFDRTVKNKQEEKERQVKLVEQFYQENGRLPKVREQYCGVAIGIFLRDVKARKRTLTKAQINRLLKLGFTIEVQNQEKERKIKLVEEFYEENGRLPKQKEKYQEEAIGVFLNAIKQGNTHITEEQMKRLLQLGFQDQLSNSKIKLIEEFYDTYGRLPEPDEHFKSEKPTVGEILLSIKIGKIRITERQFVRLQQMDVTLTREQVQLIERPKTFVKK